MRKAKPARRMRRVKKDQPRRQVLLMTAQQAAVLVDTLKETQPVPGSELELILKAMLR